MAQVIGKNFRQKSAYSLIEVLVSIAIFGIFSAGVFSFLGVSSNSINKASQKMNIERVADAIVEDIQHDRENIASYDALSLDTFPPDPPWVPNYYATKQEFLNYKWSQNLYEYLGDIDTNESRMLFVETKEDNNITYHILSVDIKYFNSDNILQNIEVRRVIYDF
jgi:prepilin-type N-terminal cleavage/methylation domain-containing protein